MPLSAEQLKNIEEKRKIALEKKKANESRVVAATSSTSNVSTIASTNRPSSTITSNSFYCNNPSSSTFTNSSSNVKKPLTFVKHKGAPNVATFNGSVSAGPDAKKLKTNSSSNPSLSNYVNSIASGQTKVVTGICKMVSRDRFAVDVGFQQQMIELFKTIPSRKYEMSTRNWSFSINDHDSLLTQLKKIEAVSVTGVPQQIRTLFKKKGEQTKEEIDLSVIDDKVLNALMPFQEEGVRFCIEHKGRAMIADDMGLGKTIQAVAVAHYYKDDWPLLIVCPSSVRFTWAEAIKTWLPSVPQYQIAVMTTAKDFVEDAKVVIVSYDLLSRTGKELDKMKFNMVILDESHSLKNFKTNRSKAAQPFAKKARRVILLSGTPALSRPIELYVQLGIINQTGMLSYHEFGVRYCNAQLKQWGWDFNGSSNMDELNLLLQECFMIRRLKKDVLSQLPAKFRQVVVLPPSSVSIKSKELKQAAQGMQRSNLRGAEKQGALLVYFNATSVAKLKGICDYVLDMVKDDKKFLCFAHHKIVLDSICDKLQAANYRFIRIDGSTDSQSRQEYCKLFQEDNRVKVAVLSITAANTGLTLTAAHLVLFTELYWNPGVLLQAEDRAHRIGQLDSVVVQYLIAQGTADDHLWHLLEKKLAVLNKAGLNADNLTATASASTKRLEDTAQPSITDFMTTDDAELDADDALLASMDLDALMCNTPDS